MMVVAVLASDRVRLYREAPSSLCRERKFCRRTRSDSKLKFEGVDVKNERPIRCHLQSNRVTALDAQCSFLGWKNVAFDVEGKSALFGARS